MQRNSQHPVRKCGKCKLNFKTHCGLFENPHAMWNGRRKCPGYLSDDHYRQYEALQLKLQTELQKRPGVAERRLRAKLRQTEPHHDGKRLVRR